MLDHESQEIEEAYKNYILSRPHIVILGAGATMAAIPYGDKYGRRCSVMQGFIDNLGLRPILNEVEIKTTSDNLEEIFSELKSRQDCEKIVTDLENRIVSKFSELVIPDEPTVYDYLLLSLRKKDFIFSFNWDDLLIQAYQRVWNITRDLPQLVFLHGNINVGRCTACGAVETLRNKSCRKCGGLLDRPKILFPVKEKNYGDDPYIKNAWDGFLDLLSRSSIVTIFGYSAPKSDILAIDAMKKAFSSTFRRLDQVEVIDLKTEHELRETWGDFIEPTNDHFKIRKSIYESILSEFPRRTVEGYWKRNFDRGGWWGRSSIQFKEGMTFDELRDLLSPLIKDEMEDKYNVL
ncbi:MAG: hypothetical protein HDR25_05595 [Lachnospiraceae bacterium]|nr:hypothetical protein [Lachnospiraceae bacterium]